MEPIKITTIDAKTLMEKVKQAAEPVKTQDPISEWNEFRNWLFTPYYASSGDFSLEADKQVELWVNRSTLPDNFVDCTNSTYKMDYTVKYAVDFETLANTCNSIEPELFDETYKQLEKSLNVLIFNI